MTAARGLCPLLGARPRHHPPGKLVRPRRGQPCRRARDDAADARNGARAGGQARHALRFRPPDPDPAYNIMLGTSYFAAAAQAMGRPCAAGGRELQCRRRQRAQMDPREWRSARPAVDIVSWIEDIPYSETRNYVQRVLENAVVYDAIRAQRGGGRPTGCPTISARAGRADALPPHERSSWGGGPPRSVVEG